ncbi:hypothetical protein E2562_025754 [Oryza meyeriana var. granulata]|uniref:Uncharacterized protein n=1 Tax=Oryza meyeriana var. granulata TaxID=110450 RepID=A0A6G1CUA7_9ORYZ|nr:hypothetical protein E2562_025754 [Oryza meyeriana var. granulata]
MAASAAGGEPQKKHLRSIIRGFATEKSHGERRVLDLKLWLDDVRAASDAAASELEAARRAREDAEQELSGSQVKAAIAAASIQALEALISHIQEEISKVGSDLDALKFQQMVSVELRGEKCCELPSEGQHVRDRCEIMESECVLEDLIDKVNNVDAEVHVLEEEYQNDLLNHDKVCIDLAPIQGMRTTLEFVAPLDLAEANCSELMATTGENHASSSSVKTPSRDNAQLSTTRDVAGKHCHSKGFSFLPSIGECESSDESTISDDEIISELSSLCSPGSDISVSSLVSSIISGQDLHISDQFLSALPPLPHFEIPLRKCQLCIDNDANESDSDGTTSNSSDGSCIELDTLQNEYAVGGPSWEAMIAPISGLALEEEEEELMLQGQILLGNDRKANRLITLFDEAERSMGQVTEMLG